MVVMSALPACRGLVTSSPDVESQMEIYRVFVEAMYRPSSEHEIEATFFPR